LDQWRKNLAKNKAIQLSAGVVFLSLWLWACAGQIHKEQNKSQCDFARHLPSMGTIFELHYVDNCVTDRTSLILSAQELLNRWEASASLYQPESEISRLNQIGELLNPSEEFLWFMKIAVVHAEQTYGYFDPTIWPVLQLIQSSFKKTGKAPPVRAIENLRPLVGFKFIHMDNKAIRLERKGVQVTLDGLVKGLAVDKLAEMFEQAGLYNYMLNFSGNARWRGHSASGASWKVVIENPKTGTYIPVPESAHAMATSAPTFNYYSADKRWHHLIDPKSLRPANLWISATVLGPSAGVCDALSKIFVMPESAIRKIFAEHYPEYSYWLFDPTGHAVNH
jgi:thiamine biosynthesis lipoprotein